MSLESWVKEAYPISADEAANGTWVDAIEHSLRKWRHADEETLKKHEVEKGIICICDFEGIVFFTFDNANCSMCIKSKNNCSECLGAQANGHACCYNNQALHGEEYNIWVDTGDSKPMVEWLEKALIYAKDKKV